MPRHLKTAAAPATTATFNTSVPKIVENVIGRIREEGDSAVRQYSEQFDSWSPPSFRLSEEDVAAAVAQVPKQTIDDIKEVQDNVRKFARAQRDSLRDFETEIRPGVHLGQKNIPIGAVGWYVIAVDYCLLLIAFLSSRLRCLRQLHSRRQISSTSVCPHDHSYRKGCWCAIRRGLHSAH